MFSTSVAQSDCSVASPCVGNVDDYFCVNQATVGALIAANNPSKIIIKTALDINQDYSFPVDCEIVMMPNAYLNIFKNVTLDHVNIRGCNGLSNGILVLGSGTVHFINGSTISNAKTAINLRNGSHAEIKNSTFLNNLTGVLLNDGANAEMTHNAFTDNQIGIEAHGNAQLLGSGISNNEFDGPLNGDVGATGIKLMDVAYMAIGTTGLNTFKEFKAQSIKAENSNVGISNADFDGVFAQSVGVRLESANGTHKATISGPAVTFDNFSEGINSSDYNLTVNNCTFTNNYKGVVVVEGLVLPKPANLSITDNTLSGIRQTGIQVLAARVNDALINNNFIHDDNPDLNSSVHIGINWSVNKVLGKATISNNTFVDEEKAGVFNIQGIVANSALRINISDNTVTQSFEPSSNAYVFQGIRAYFSNECNISGNHIEGHSPIGQDIQGMYILHSQGNISCNNFENLPTGIQFEDDCDGTHFGQNKIWDSNGTGLHLMSDAIIGEQKFTGNAWPGTQAQGLEGRAESSGIFLSMSKFYIQTPETANTVYWAIPRTPGGDSWFTYSSNGDDNPYHVINNCTGIDEIDPVDPQKTAANKASIADNFPAYRGYPASSWEAEMAAYELLRKHPALISPETSDLIFYTGRDNSNVGKFARALDAWRNFFHFPTGMDVSWSQNQEDISDKLQEIKAYETQLQTAANSSEEQILLEALVGLKSELAILQQNNQILSQQYDVHVSNQLDLLLTDLSNINTSTIYEQNLKTVLSLLANREKSAMRIWSAPDLTTLNAIAGQCRHEGGVGVLMARSILEQFDYDDASLCPEVEDRSTSTVQAVPIAPNPADTYCHLTFNRPVSGVLVGRNMQGQIVQQVSFAEVHTLDLNTSTWPNGAYHLTVLAENGTRYAILLLVAH